MVRHGHGDHRYTRLGLGGRGAGCPALVKQTRHGPCRAASPKVAEIGVALRARTHPGSLQTRRSKATSPKNRHARETTPASQCLTHKNKNCKIMLAETGRGLQRLAEAGRGLAFHDCRFRCLFLALHLAFCYFMFHPILIGSRWNSYHMLARFWCDSGICWYDSVMFV